LVRQTSESPAYDNDAERLDEGVLSERVKQLGAEHDDTLTTVPVFLDAITLPHALRRAHGFLTSALAKYLSVQDQKAQCKVLLDQCSNLVVAVAKRLERPSDQHLVQNVEVLEGYALI
jgi:hypothetical protein